MSKAPMCAVAVALIALSLPAAGQTQAPQVCHTKAVKVTGGLSILENGARGKARGAWIKKVRDNNKLGPAYAIWLRAKDPNYNCKKFNKRFQCEASAIPCKG